VCLCFEKNGEGMEKFCFSVEWMPMSSLMVACISTPSISFFDRLLPLINVKNFHIIISPLDFLGKNVLVVKLQTLPGPVPHSASVTKFSLENT